MHFAPLFQDHAVLQRNLPIPVWGTAGRDETVTVHLAGQSARVISETDGRWLVHLPALPAGGPFELMAESPSGKVIVTDILIGDVWICSGQSNMEWQVKLVISPDNKMLLEDLPQVRLLTVANPARLGRRQEEIHGQWVAANPKTLLDFSAVGGWFGRELNRELGIPIGLICTAWGGTRIQTWISREALMQDPTMREEVLAYEREIYALPSAGGYISFEDWETRGAPKDTGNIGLTKGWAAPDFDDSPWITMPIPSRWQEHGYPGNGVFWHRHSVAIPADWIGRDLELHLGQIDKHDDTWVNGERVGGLSWEAGPTAWCTPRVYPIPAHLVGADGRLVIAVRARCHVFNGGLFGPKNAMFVVPSGEASATPMSLVGSWHFAVEQDWGVVQPPALQGAGNANSPFILFDSRVRPLLPYGICGVIWYQGESNTPEPALYRRLLPVMIREWRREWGQGDFPFLQVQLTNFMAPAEQPRESQWAELRDAQMAALSEPNTGMAVAIDIGEQHDIHPPDKRSVGLRLARWGLAEVYGQGGVPSGPLYTRATPEANGRMRIHFQYGAGLSTRDGEAPKQVAIAGRDRRFIWAECRIEGETLLVWHPEIAQPFAVRYAWADNPEGCNLVNGAGLPASPFRTDEWSSKPGQ